MSKTLDVVLLGDFNEDVVAHRAVGQALELAAQRLPVPFTARWVSSVEGETYGVRPDGIWCVPGSPYRSTPGVLRMITWALDEKIPFLGTCGGMQYALLAFAHRRLGWGQAVHGEEHPELPHQLLVPLRCSRVEVSEEVRLAADSHVGRAYGEPAITAGFHCRYGVDPAHLARLTLGGLRASAWDLEGDPLAFEWRDHPFFVGTLFQPEREALQGQLPAVMAAWLKAVAGQALQGAN